MIDSLQDLFSFLFWTGFNNLMPNTYLAFFSLHFYNRFGYFGQKFVKLSLNCWSIRSSTIAKFNMADLYGHLREKLATWFVTEYAFYISFYGDHIFEDVWKKYLVNCGWCKNQPIRMTLLYRRTTAQMHHAW